jgi:hypothetical protein
MRWAAFSALAWVAVIALFAIAVQGPARPPDLSPSSSTSYLARELSAVVTTGSSSHLPWVVTRASAAMNALVIDVEARDPDNSRQIAEEIVAPVRRKYAEILIYVRPAGAGANARVRRIQWTPRGGFVESVF